MSVVSDALVSDPSPAAAETAPQQTAILVVDDSAVDRRLAGGILEKNSEYRAVYAGNGAEALTLIAQEPPGAVLTDLLMPEMDGLELVEAIRSKYPLVPVILMTAHGSEDIAFQALHRGAASYVPKKFLARDLHDTLEQVMVVAKVGRQSLRLRECLVRTESHFLLDNDRTLLPALVAQLQEDLGRMQLCDQAGRIRVGIALEEALVNALYHGNLEVSSELRQNGDEPYHRLAEERRSQPPYRDRRIHVGVCYSHTEAQFTIRDEGPGFDPSTLPDPTDPDNLGKTSGRGLLLIQTFMDEVRFNETGNQITMILRRKNRTV